MAGRSVLKGFFTRGAKPTAGQFASLIDSYWHKDEDSIPVVKINGLTATLAGKAATADIENEAAVRAAADDDLQTQIDALAGSFDMRAFISLAPVCADEAAAVTAGLTAYTLYKTATGELRYKLPAEGEGFTYTLPLILS